MLWGNDVEAIYGKPSKCIITIIIMHLAKFQNEFAVLFQSIASALPYRFSSQEIASVAVLPDEKASKAYTSMTHH